jgi:hypothetical protein
MAFALMLTFVRAIAARMANEPHHEWSLQSKGLWLLWLNAYGALRLFFRKL